ncbi:SusC/RagA family TonB-linked outer membrane protein [Sinomicrobium soli]|uniref:SusC/RagA family TonB-linked outer membrane protein n=1 Tax=Sinomicrobium sp. N-1-3-6 TaxID=2219864 RepID=UPI000DCD3BCB|nr:TonB-dependent receptor [Sinomicrobium sp. N-1-3-6]RAV28622.1 SusC/RagA family TonB-linked outer membrane protein [Sinomicrobium sp. N-1-3-6]
MRIRNCLFHFPVLLAFMVCTGLSGQTVISGSVFSSQDGEPLPGVNIVIQGTSEGTVTDFDGKYSLTVHTENPVLVFSYVGFKSQSVAAGNKTVVDVGMEEDLSALDEVIVVGYGTQRRRDVTGAISSISTKDVEGVPVRSVDQVLQGRAAGVSFVQSSGMPGAGASIRIRGGNSINGSNEPLYVIDGVPITVNIGDAASLNPLNSINPSDVESIEILKDASATSIYGSRGGNGVVLITTKRGKSGKGRVNVNYYSGIQKETKRYNLLNAKQFETLANEASIADGGPILYDPALHPATTDWQDAMLRNFAPVHDVNVSANGGKEGSTYMASFGYFKQEGIIKTSDLERYSFRLNMDQVISDKVKIGNNLSASYVQTNRANNGSLFSMLTLPPNLPVKQPDGSYTQFNNLGIGFNNPIALLNDYKNLTKTFRAIGNLFVSVELMEGLTVKSSWGLDYINNRNDTYLPQTVYTGALIGGDGSVFTGRSITWLNENTANFVRSFQDHKIDVLVGFTQQSSRYESLGASATGFLNDITNTNSLGLGDPEAAVLPSSSSSNWVIHSYIGRVNYNFRDRYLLTLTGRVDGSSRFGSNNRYGFFPSAAFSWRAIDEAFIENLNVFSDMKVRTSYGITGNQEGIGNYPAIDLWGGTQYVIGDQIVSGITPYQMGNRNLKWERTQQLDVGLELGFFNNDLTLVTDLYYKKTNDLLLNVQVPATSGFTEGTRNIGSIENRGVELTVNATPFHGEKLNWNSSFNITFNRNEILNLGGEEEILPSSSPTILRLGESLGTFYGYKSEGLFQSLEEVVSSAQPTARPGDVRYVDYNGDGVINDNDRQIIGNAQPKFFGGFSNTLSYKGWELTCLLQYSYGNDLYNLNLRTLENLTGLQNQRTTVMDRWTADNRNTYVPRATATKPMDVSYDRYVEDGSYLRLKTLQLGYNIPSGIIDRLGLSNARIFINAQNLVTWTNYTGLDPEVSRYGSDNINQGFDSGAYPNTMTITTGVNINF